MKLAFEVPTSYISDFADLQDFRVARADWAIRDPKYRERLKPIDLLLANPMPLDELRRIVALTSPAHVTVTLPTDVTEAAKMLTAISVVGDGELAVVTPVEAVEVALLAIEHEVSILAIPLAPKRVRWAMELASNTVEAPIWIHFLELQGPAEYREILDANLPHVSLHTALPLRAAFHSADLAAAAELPDADMLTQRLTPEQVTQARALMEAMREVAK